MRRLIGSTALALVVALSTPALADGPPPSEALVQARTLKVTGIVLTSLAMTTLVLGLTLWSYSVFSNNSNDNHLFEEAVAGYTLLGFSPAFAAAGIPMWVVGSVREKRLTRRIVATPVGVFATF